MSLTKQNPAVHGGSIKPITKYQATDGAVFDSMTECLLYENQCRRVAEIMAALVPTPSDPQCRFENGDGYIQQDPAIVERVKNELLDTARLCLDWHDAIEKSRPWPASRSIIGRVLDDTGTGVLPLRDGWYRLLRIDPQGREWGQCYFANNPNEGKQICLNPK